MLSDLSQVRGKYYNMISSPLCKSTQHILVVTEISGQPVGPIFKGQEVRENGTDRLSLNVGM